MSAAVITVPAFASARDGVRHFFGTRRHADSLALDVGVPARQSGAMGRGWLLSVKQVHGTDALVVDRPLTESDQFPGGWDALVTDQPGVTVAVRTADCVPAVAGIVPKTIALMATRFGSMRSDLRISIGPSAGPCCYEVDDPVLEYLRVGLPDWQSVVRGYRGHKARLDLKALIRRQVEELGVSSLSVSAVNLCTICNDQLFYSYRREGRVNGTMVSGLTLLSNR
jgi:hypothetical protein